MTLFFARNRTVLVLACLLPLMGLVLLMAFAPGEVRFSTYGVAVALAVGTLVVVRSTWQQAQPLASFRHERYEGRHPADGGARTSWDRWIARADRSAAEGRAQAALALSVGVTAILAWAWLA